MIFLVKIMPEKNQSDSFLLPLFLCYICFCRYVLQHPCRCFYQTASFACYRGYARGARALLHCTGWLMSHRFTLNPVLHVHDDLHRLYSGQNKF